MIRPCSRAACNTVYNETHPDNAPFVKVQVMGVHYLYCCPRCASVDLTERFVVRLP